MFYVSIVFVYLLLLLNGVVIEWNHCMKLMLDESTGSHFCQVQ